ncbi:MAG TPA: transglycosylase SLT domain-containing protein [Candidatus Dormibacteraeota bacterium]|nr:transglycosylase SLT domain-containing protein [Candidatus Dormibacteraeota bacterium]
MASLLLALASGVAMDRVFAQSKRSIQRGRKSKTKRPRNTRPPFIGPAASPAPLSPEDEVAQQQLSRLARSLQQGFPAAYVNLSEFADKHASDPWGARAALALGYADFSKGRVVPAAIWLEKGMKDPVLKDYSLYWRSQVERAQHHDAAALSDLETIRRDFPDSALSEQVVQAFAAAAITLGKARDAAEALGAYPNISSRPALLLERAMAWQSAGALDRAAKDYQDLYYRHPLNDEARVAGANLAQLAKRMGAEFLSATPEQQEPRAQAFFDTHKWNEAQAEFEKLLSMLGKKTDSIASQRARLRIAQARAQLKNSASALSSLVLTDSELDAERLYSLSQALRPKQHETEKHDKEMFAALEQLEKQYPDSRWNEEALFATGNFYWVNLDRTHAASLYQRVLEKYPGSKYIPVAHWRTAWVAYLQQNPGAANLLEEHLSRFPGSTYTVNALYWLGRLAERSGNTGVARGFYLAAEGRFPQTYFARAAIIRLHAIGREPVTQAEILSTIIPVQPLVSLREPVPAAAVSRWTRAEVLRTIAFDASAELELRAAYFATAAPRLIFEAAQTALDQGHYPTAMALGRIAVPNIDARKLDEVPLAAWHTIFPLPYEAIVRREAARNEVDPMLVAGLMRQESTFQSDIISHKGAVGLMQVLPMTGRRLARRLKLRYSREKLTDPEYNLRLGTLYLSDLLKEFGSPEAALAAFNAGEDRISVWQGERKHEEIAELVESVPFTETREYIQIVLRNAEVYRMVYGETGKQGVGQR